MKKINLFSKIVKMLQLMKIQFFILSFNHNEFSLNAQNFIMIYKTFFNYSLYFCIYEAFYVIFLNNN